MTMEFGTYGAKVQSWGKANPREILFDIISKMPGASKQAVFDEFWQHVSTEEDALKTIAEYWFANNYHSAFNSRQRPRLSKATKTVEDVKKIISAKAVTIFLDLVLPNGKMLRDSTGKDCIKAGGFFAAIAKKIKPTDVVGKKLSEAEVAKIFNGA